MSTKERNIFGIRNQVDISYKEITGSYKYYITSNIVMTKKYN